jgi:hypothetical protein
MSESGLVLIKHNLKVEDIINIPTLLMNQLDPINFFMIEKYLYEEWVDNLDKVEIRESLSDVALKFYSSRKKVILDINQLYKDFYDCGVIYVVVEMEDVDIKPDINWCISEFKDNRAFIIMTSSFDLEFRKDSIRISNLYSKFNSYVFEHNYKMFELTRKAVLDLIKLFDTSGKYEAIYYSDYGGSLMDDLFWKNLSFSEILKLAKDNYPFSLCK